LEFLGGSVVMLTINNNWNLPIEKRSCRKIKHVKEGSPLKIKIKTYGLYLQPKIQKIHVLLLDLTIYSAKCWIKEIQKE
jgi:hypothetical protein